MKSHLLTLLAITALATGCNQEQTTSQFFAKAQTGTKETAKDIKDYTYAEKPEFVERTRSELDEINRDLDQLAAKIERSSGSAKAEATPKLQALRDQASKLSQQLNEAKGATESTWGDVKDGFSKGYNEFKSGLQTARQWVSDKIAP
jgi:hypothetical protein